MSAIERLREVITRLRLFGRVGVGNPLRSLSMIQVDTGAGTAWFNGAEYTIDGDFLILFIDRVPTKTDGHTVDTVLTGACATLLDSDISPFTDDTMVLIINQNGDDLLGDTWTELGNWGATETTLSSTEHYLLIAQRGMAPGNPVEMTLADAIERGVLLADTRIVH